MKTKVDGTGAEDILTPPSEVEMLAAAIPNARLARIESAGHLAALAP